MGEHGGRARNEYTRAPSKGARRPQALSSQSVKGMGSQFGPSSREVGTATLS